MNALGSKRSTLQGTTLERKDRHGSHGGDGVDRLGLRGISSALSGLKPRTELVAAALGMVRSSLAELGRCLCSHRGVAAKHCIKRADRFVGNARIEPAEEDPERQTLRLGAPRPCEARCSGWPDLASGCW